MDFPRDDCKAGFARNALVRSLQAQVKQATSEKQEAFLGNVQALVVTSDDPTRISVEYHDRTELSPAFNEIFDHFFAALNAQDKVDWRFTIFAKNFGAGNKKRCVRKAVAQSMKGHYWTHTTGLYACDECVAQGLPCFFKQEYDFCMLPLHPSDRADEEPKDSLATECYVVPGRYDAVKSGKKLRIRRPKKAVSPPVAEPRKRKESRICGRRRRCAANGKARI